MTINSDILKLNGKEKNGNSQLNDLKMSGHTKEQILLKDLKNLAQEYQQLEFIKRNFSKIVTNNMESLDFSEFIKYPKYFIKEATLKKDQIKVANLGGLNIVSVDGSSVVKKFMNVDFSFLKAIAVKYHFNKNSEAVIEYYPDLGGFNNYAIQGNFFTREEHLVESKTSMDMTFMEINLLNKMIKRSTDIDIIILDGSIVPMPINLLFSTDFELSKKYDRLLKEYNRLYSNCKEKGIILIGSIKDTRTSALTHLLRDSIQLLKPSYNHLKEFIEFNYRQVFEYFSDLDLFNRLLDKSERSCIFQCKREVDKIRDTGIKKEIPYYFPLDFYAFYIKTAKYDMPCRIEFFTDESESIDKASKKADLVSSIILPISSLNEHYGLPIPQIEAHRRAVFKPDELNLLFNSLKRIFSINGVNLLEKRRNRRPF